MTENTSPGILERVKETILGTSPSSNKMNLQESNNAQSAEPKGLIDKAKEVVKDVNETVDHTIESYRESAQNRKKEAETKIRVDEVRKEGYEGALLKGTLIGQMGPEEGKKAYEEIKNDKENNSATSVTGRKAEQG